MLSFNFLLFACNPVTMYVIKFIPPAPRSQPSWAPDCPTIHMGRSSKKKSLRVDVVELGGVGISSPQLPGQAAQDGQSVGSRNCSFHESQQ